MFENLPETRKIHVHGTTGQRDTGQRASGADLCWRLLCLVFEEFEKAFAVVSAQGKLGPVAKDDGVVA